MARSEVVVRTPHRVCFVGRGHTKFAAALLALSFSLGCSEDDPQQAANGGGSGSGNAGAAGSQGGTATTNGGSAGSATSGESGSAGAAGTSGAAGSAGSTAEDPTTPLSGNLCSGISNGDPCAVVGTCAGRVCGLADLGTRDCVCRLDKIWDCTSCAFPMGDDQPSVLIPPGTGDAGALRECEANVNGDVPCSPMGDRCQQGEDVCACWIVEDGVNVWDCDNPPSFWP